jgi:hypothetical protein
MHRCNPSTIDGGIAPCLKNLIRADWPKNYHYTQQRALWHFQKSYMPTKFQLQDKANDNAKNKIAEKTKIPLKSKV